MTSRFSISTTSSSSTNSTYTCSPPISPDLPTSSTLTSAAYLSISSTTPGHPHISRWPGLSRDGLPRSSASSMTRPHRFHSPGATPDMRSPSQSTRCFTPPPTTTTTTSTHPTQPAPSARSSPPSLEPGRPLPRNAALSLVESRTGNSKRNRTAIVRMGRSMGRGLRRCSGFFKPRPDDPDEVEEVPKPVHWSEN